MASLLARLRGLDNDVKQVIFGCAAIVGVMFVAGFVLFLATGEAGLMVGAAVWVGILLVLAGIGWVAERLFPSG